MWSHSHVIFHSIWLYFAGNFQIKGHYNNRVWFDRNQENQLWQKTVSISIFDKIGKYSTCNYVSTIKGESIGCYLSILQVVVRPHFLVTSCNRQTSSLWSHTAFMLQIYTNKEMFITAMFITSLAKEVVFSVVFVCLSTSNVTQKVMSGLWWNFIVGSRVLKLKGRTD